MDPARRNFLKKSGTAMVAGILPWNFACTGNPEHEEPAITSGSEGTSPASAIRNDFDLDPQYIHMDCLLLSSHPRPVQEAINEYRKSLNLDPSQVQKHYSSYQKRIREAAAGYMNVKPDSVAITDSTTMGTALLINGLHIRENQEMLTAELDYPATHHAIEFKAARSGASYRKVSIYGNPQNLTEDEIVDKLSREIRSNTRLVTGTWVHSAHGLKIPVRKIADRINEINEGRDPKDRAIFFLDGVHGFGVENTPVGDLGCELFAAGLHKWMFGPRGTGVMWAHPLVQDQVSPTIPTFTNNGGWGGAMTPGGFKSFEHQWAMDKAFEYHQQLGKEHVQERIYSLAQQLKEGLSKMDHVKLHTPMSQKLSAGIVCFEIGGMSTQKVVNQLLDKNIIGSSTPYGNSYPRLSPGIYNTTEEIEEVLRAVHDLS